MRLPRFLTGDELLMREIGEAAKRQNHWDALWAVLAHEGGDGYVPNGFVMFERQAAPFGFERAFATARWNKHGRRIGFESGNYDMTQEDAWRDLLDRSKVKRIGGPA
jgi:hypothetical protein